MINLLSTNAIKKWMHRFTGFAVMLMITLCFMSTGDVYALDVEFETFLKSVSEGEFVLSEEDAANLTKYIEAGNTSAAMKIYQDYFSGQVQSEAAPVAVTVSEVVENQVESASAPEVVEKKAETATASEVVENKVETMITDVAVIETGIAKEVTDQVIAQPVNIVRHSIEAIKDEKKEETGAIIGAEEINMHGLSETDYDALCRIVEAEAGGECSDGKIMVANVVMNRVSSEVFPNSVMEVVSQHGQFSPYRNGSFRKAKPSNETIIAVNKALSGEKLSNALYFKAKRTGLRWGKRRLISVCGNHAFYL